MDAQVSVHFLCQRCRQPIILDEGFSHLNEHTLAELSLPVIEGCDVDFKNLNLDRIISPLQLQDSNSQALGFTLVGDAADHEKSQPMKVLTTLFDKVNSNSDVDYPLCEECTDVMMDLIDQKLTQERKQVLAYVELVESLKDTDQDDVQHLEDLIEELTQEEASLVKELEDIKIKKTKAEALLAESLEDKKGLEEEETRFWREYCNFKSQYVSQVDEEKSLKNRVRHMNIQLENLEKKNAFNTAFNIFQSGHFGTINNLRLGRLPTVPVEWSEINAAWGLTVLLLQSLANKVGLEFSKYRLVPFGNASYIEVRGSNKELHLYACGGFRLMWDNNFDDGMAAFLECAAEFQKFVESQGLQDSKKSFCLPYKINKHYIEDLASGEAYSIKMQFNKDENWTKALKFLLTNLKWGLAWVSAMRKR